MVNGGARSTHWVAKQNHGKLCPCSCDRTGGLDPSRCHVAIRATGGDGEKWETNFYLFIYFGFIDLFIYFC